MDTLPIRSSRRYLAVVGLIAALFLLAVISAACGGDDGNADDPAATPPETTEAPEQASPADQSRTADIDVCALLSDAEISAVLGATLPSEASEPAGPFTGCSWGTGTLIVQIAPADSLILAPGEEDCPSAGLGDDSVVCEGRVKFLTNGIHASVQTIESVSDDQLLALATTLLPKLQE